MTEKLESIDWHGNVTQGMLDAMVHGYIYALMNATEAPARIVRALLGRCSNYLAEVCGAYRNKVPYRRPLRPCVITWPYFIAVSISDASAASGSSSSFGMEIFPMLDSYQQ